jgi:hypothetical protein
MAKIGSEGHNLVFLKTCGHTFGKRLGKCYKKVIFIMENINISEEAYNYSCNGIQKIYLFSVAYSHGLRMVGLTVHYASMLHAHKI